MSAFDEFPATRLKALRSALLEWYARCGRPLPWRATRDPYRIWLSEVMLQQTTVVAVVPYFERFLARFPDVRALAAAPLDEVLRLWEGLGYYSRARNLHAAARAVVDRHAGEFPRDVAALEGLPGVGRYTAGAVASFAFDVAAPIVEANTQRLYARLLGYDGDLQTATGRRLLWSFAERIAAHATPGTINQATMELGSRVCAPQARCEECPLSRWCRAFRDGRQHEIPRAKVRPEITAVREQVIAVYRQATVPTPSPRALATGERATRRTTKRLSRESPPPAIPDWARSEFLLLRQPEGGRFAGLWDFVRVAALDDPPPDTPRRTTSGGRRRAPEPKLDAMKPDPVEAATALVAERVVRQVGLAVGIRIARPSHCGVIRHSITRYRITLDCYLAEHEGGTINSARYPEHAWVALPDLAHHPLSTTGRRLADQLCAAAK